MFFVNTVEGPSAYSHLSTCAEMMFKHVCNIIYDSVSYLDFMPLVFHVLSIIRVNEC